MNDDSLGAPKPENGNRESSVAAQTVSVVKEIQEDPSPTQHAIFSSPPSNDNRDHVLSTKNGEAANDKSDSEAETVVLSGKDDATAQKQRKAIKHENMSDAESQRNTKTSPHQGSEKRREENGEHNGDRPSLKRKRVVQESAAEEAIEGANSSNLSSTISSPALEARSSKRGESESDRSRSSPPYDEAVQQKEGKLRNRKTGHDVDEQGRKQRGKSDPSSENLTAKDRRGTRSIAHNEVPIHRSESPPLRVHKRAHSTQSNRSETYGGNKRRKIPPPLLVDRRRKASEDTHGDSDDSSSVHSHRYLQKFASTDNHAMSPAKMSHKKYRDKNGRTLLARACSLDFVEAELRLKERPQDLNIPDNAGNTPLQIASLEGKSNIVQLLLDAGCDITCKNTDMETPLIDAVENGHLDVVRMLLKAGLDPRQSNAKGEEPLDLVNAENDHYDAIRAALIAAKEKDKNRRPSEDHNWQPNPGGRDQDTSSLGASAGSPTDSLPVHGTRSPPPALGARRRTARSQPTRDGLLWVNATPENLRNAAGKGDLTIVDHILKMRPEADSESVLAAARGGHEIVLELLIAIGKPDPDPRPLRSSDVKPAFSTPMLAAIGRGNVKVVQLLLNQPGFDPTRRLYKELTYFEIAKERQGSDWEEEYKVLKEAFDHHAGHTAKKANHGSPRKIRNKRPESQKSTPETSSPLSVGKTQSAESAVLDDSKKENKRVSKHRSLSHKHLRVSEVENQDVSATVSDRESESHGPPKIKSKGARSASDVGSSGSKQVGMLKPRRKLLSRNDLKSDQDTRRRASLADASSVSSQDNPRRASSDSAKPGPKIRKDVLKETSLVKSESGKKRSRVSASPQDSISDMKESDSVKIKKRRRVDSQGNAITQNYQRPLQAGPAMVANMIPISKPEPLPGNTKGAAPVAFMGVSVTSPIIKSPSPLNKSPTEISTIVESNSPVSRIDQALQQNLYQHNLEEQRRVEASTQQQLTIDQRKEADTRSERELETARKESEARRKAAAEEAKKALEAKEAAEEKARIEHAEEEARLALQRQEKEAERQLKLEREEEEARVARKRREEEQQKRRIEQERLRKEEQDRRRAESEERERARRIQVQEEEERKRRESLPNGLKRAAELSLEEARSVKEITKWLPLHTVTSRELDPSCNEEVADERWIANVQAAPILAITDLDLSQCKVSPIVIKSLSPFPHPLFLLDLQLTLSLSSLPLF